jgi:diguanylate cyclase (GGDEF)-like protein/PAS domain S-box-containing protein
MTTSDTGEVLRVLILEDQVADVELCERELRRAGLKFVSRRVETLAGLEAELERFSPDLVLSDFTFPGDFDGLRALETARSRAPGIPFIFVSGTIGEERAVEAMRLGAVDYVLKDRMARLGPAVRRALELMQMRRARDAAERAMRESESKYSALIDQASDGIFLNDRDGRVLFSNARFREMLGYTEEEMRGLSMAQTYPAEERPRFLTRVAQLPAGGSRTLERMMVRKDGGAFPVEISIRHLPDGTRQGIARDITERRRQEQRIEKLSRVRAVSSQVNAAIVRSPNRQMLFYEACRIAIELGNFGIAWIGAYDAGKMEVTPVASAGLEGDTFLSSSTLVISPDSPQSVSTLAVAVRERRPVWNNDIVADADAGGKRRQEAIRRGYRSMIGLPLTVEGAVVATFSLFAKEANFFDAEEVNLLAELAGNLSFALADMARQERLEKLSRIRAVSSGINAAIVRIGDRQTLLRETCRIASELGRFEMVWVAEIDQKAEEVRPLAWVGFSEEAARAVGWKSIGAAHGTLGEAIASRRASVRNDIGSELPVGKLRQEAVQAGYLSTVCVPLVVDDGVTALITLFAAGRDFFDENELGLLNELAADVSFALQSIAQREKVEYLSYYDATTGLPNRALFMDRAGQQMRSRTGETVMVALILVNIERFRNINDAFGRRGGDDLLGLVAQRLEQAFRGKDYIARIGPDGFGIVLRGIRDAAAVVHVVENQVLSCFRAPYTLGDQPLRVGARAGVALYPVDGEDADTLFRNAEAALKKSRESGERYLFYAAEMNARAAQVISLETRLRIAVDQRQFVLHYQPKFGLVSGQEKLCGLEALIRWQEPGGKLVSPGEFIPLLEETGLILDVGKWALEQALTAHREWTARGLAVPRIAVNVSPIQLQQRDFADLVVGAVHQEGDHPEALELEVTESLLMKDVKASIQKLSVLRGVGIHVAMDDFGTGYSSLSYIARLPINSVKIDRSFINGMAGSPQDMAIVTTIIALAHSLNLRVVAEGVETREQARLLALLKCDEAQGFLYSKPLPEAETDALLRAHSAAAAAR